MLLRGRAVVNESTLTGESVPQLKDPLTVERGAAEARPLDVKTAHRVHTIVPHRTHSSPASQAAQKIRLQRSHSKALGHVLSLASGV